MAISTALVACTGARAGMPVDLPDGAPGIGFDDLRYSPTLHRVLVPAGRTGRLNLIDPENLAVTSIGGFSSKSHYSGGHDDGPTSADEARGKIYVTDRSNHTLALVDPVTRTIVTMVNLAAEPDYVRFVAATNELWVSEPNASQLEIFKLDAAGSPVSDGAIAIQNGPESLVIDPARGRAYAHRWQKTSVAIDVKTRAIVAEWPNGCASSRGIALDESHGWLFSVCNEGTAAILDLNNNGAIVSMIARGSGFDVIGYNPTLGHLYLAGTPCDCLMIIGVTNKPELRFIERISAPAGTHCAVADDIGHAWVCDPDHGRLRRVDDRHARSLQ